MFGAWRGNTSWVAPLAWHPENRNAVIMVDLAGDISPLLELDSDTLRERLYTAKADLGDNAAVPVKLVHINKCPVLAQRIRYARKMPTDWELIVSIASIT